MTTAVATGRDSLSADRPSTYGNIETQYAKILRLRDKIFADEHPTLKLLKQVPPTPKHSAPPAPIPAVNRLPEPAAKVSAPTLNSTSRIEDVQLASKPVHVTARGSSGIDPIFLEKSDVLVRAEAQQKRQRLERALDEQLIQKRAFARQNVMEEYALPDFNVTEVLRKAHEIVKPVKVLVRDANIRTTSSSDSFDENTFYSSRMDSLSEQTDASAKKPGEIEEQAANFSQPMEVNSGDANEPTSSRSQIQKRNLADEKDLAPPIPLSQEEQIARLEEQLRQLKGQDGHLGSQKTSPATREEDVAEEPPYSPPDVRASPPTQPIVSNVGKSITTQNQRQNFPKRASKALEPQEREFLRRNEIAPSPMPNDMRIVRNHITSPLAPQPARVSPLAVSKEPPVSQARNNRQYNKDPGDGVAAVGSRYSPNQPIQSLNSRKRRRRTNSGENGRNVAARREAASPEVHIKKEPISPRQRPAALGAWRPPVREEVPRPIVIDNASPRQIPVERVEHPRRYERPSRVYAVEQGRPLTPSGLGSRFVEFREEPDLRRIVSAKQIRAPISPTDQYIGSQSYPTRATSQVHLPQSNSDPRLFHTGSQVHLSPASQDTARQYRASVQPPPVSAYGPERSPSPPPRQAQRSPRQGSVAMAPPPRRIVVDQYGNKFVEAPASILQERQTSTVPLARSGEYEPRYEQPLRAPTNRHFSTDVNYGEPRYTQRPPSPASPRYVEYPSQATPARARSIVYLDNEHHQEGHINQRNDAGMVHYIEYPTNTRVEGTSRPREITRMSSVRPMGSQYEVPREQVARMPSVRPEQGRVVSLSGRRDTVPQISRQVSVRPEDVYMRPPIIEERPRYQYVPEPQQQRYAAPGAYDDGVVFEASNGVGRRIIQ